MLSKTALEDPRRKFRLALRTSAAVSVLSVLLACLFGPLAIPAADVFRILAAAAGFSGQAASDSTWSVVVLDLRLSRIVLSWMVGASLAVAGVVFQGILRNPLADPFTLGVSSGAAFGASLAIYLGVAGLLAGAIGIDVLPLAAMGGAMLALAAVILLGRVGGYLQRETLVLAGIVVATILSALISLVKSLDEESVANIVFWIMGSFHGRGWNHVALFAPYFVIGLLVVWRFSRELDILSLGEVQARQLGMNAGRTRMFLLIGASLTAGAAVAVSGVIGFVGLVVPHLVRLFQGAEHRPLLATSCFFGGFLLLWSDVVARTILPEGAELPVGVVTALIGGPFFCLLLRRKARRTLS